MSQLKAGAVLNYMVILLNTIVGLLYTPYMLRMMGQSEYGLYALVASVISYLTILDLGLGNAVIRYTAKFRAEGKQTEQYEMFGMFMVLYLVIGVIALLSGSILYFNVDILFGSTMSAIELDKARIMVAMLIFNVAFTFPMSIFGSIITAYERFVFPRVVNITRIILNTVVMICLLHLGYKAVAMVVVQTVFNVLTLLLNYIYCRRYLKIKMYYKKFRWGFLKEVAIYSFWIFLNVVMDRIYWNSGQFVLGAMVGTAAVAVFAVAIQLQHMYMQFSSSISGLFLPKVTSMVAIGNDDNALSDLFIRTGRIQYIIMALVLSGFIVFGKQFILLWAGTEYEEAYIICLLFFCALLIPLIQNLGITILQARNQMSFRSILYIIIAFIALGAQILLAGEYGGVGCAIAIAGALFLGQGIIMNIYYHMKQGLDILLFWKEILKMSVIPFIVCIGAIFFLRNTTLGNWQSLGVAVVGFAAIYIPLFYRFSMNQSERDMFAKPIRNFFRK